MHCSIIEIAKNNRRRVQATVTKDAWAKRWLHENEKSQVKGTNNIGWEFIVVWSLEARSFFPSRYAWRAVTLLYCVREYYRTCYYHYSALTVYRGKWELSKKWLSSGRLICPCLRRQRKEFWMIERRREWKIDGLNFCNFLREKNLWAFAQNRIQQSITDLGLDLFISLLRGEKPRGGKDISVVLILIKAITHNTYNTQHPGRREEDVQRDARESERKKEKEWKGE